MEFIVSPITSLEALDLPGSKAWPPGNGSNHYADNQEEQKSLTPTEDGHDIQRMNRS